MTLFLFSMFVELDLCEYATCVFCVATNVAVRSWLCQESHLRLSRPIEGIPIKRQVTLEKQHRYPMQPDERLCSCYIVISIDHGLKKWSLNKRNIRRKHLHCGKSSSNVRVTNTQIYLTIMLLSVVLILLTF